jgi:hypothetical protein
MKKHCRQNIITWNKSVFSSNLILSQYSGYSQKVGNKYNVNKSLTRYEGHSVYLKLELIKENYDILNLLPGEVKDYKVHNISLL